MQTQALLSDDRKYRYWLLRVWDEALPLNCICGVNPSTADETSDDATIRKDIGFSKLQGFGGLLKLNLAAIRSTDPTILKKVPDSIGKHNTPQHLRNYYEHFKPTQFIVAWGKNGNYFPEQSRAILEEFPQAMCFGKNGDNTPRHTLMLPYSTVLEKYSC